MRVAVVDIGTNSTRVLVTDVEGGRVTGDLLRDSRVTRLGQGVDSSGRLSDEAVARVFTVLGDYRREIDALDADHAVAVLTSAVRDAENGPSFAAEVERRYGLAARTIEGSEEARLTFLGATSERAPAQDGGQILVVDIGGGSTELVVGRGREISFFTSLQAGVVRLTERHVHGDPPEPEELQALTADVLTLVEDEVPAAVRRSVGAGIAVAGTATSAAAIDLRLEPYDPTRAHGHVLPEGTLELQLARLAQMNEEERRAVPGLHPDRAPTIVAGVAMLLECMRAFGLERIEVSDHDILRGCALHVAAGNAWT
jgi:exopolyphosphatase / guanosine-5'-triphosphate,3'-diphosphate pyrophosphatase